MVDEVGEFSRRVASLKSRLRDLVQAIPSTYRQKLASDAGALQDEISALQVAAWRLQNAQAQCSTSARPDLGMRASAQIQKEKHKLFRGSLRRKHVEAKIAELQPAMLVSIESLLLTADSQGYLLESDPALQSLRIQKQSCGRAFHVQLDHKLLHAQTRTAHTMATIKRKIQFIKEWKREVFPETRGCRRQQMLALKSRASLRALINHLAGWRSFVRMENQHRGNIARLRLKGLLVDILGWSSPEREGAHARARERYGRTDSLANGKSLTEHSHTFKLDLQRCVADS